MDVLQLRSELKSAAEIDTQPVGIGAIARTLEGNEALPHLGVAFELSGHEGRVLPRIIDPDAPPCQAVGRDRGHGVPANKQE